MISIILPVFNGENFIQLAIDGILNQTYNHFELIIVNDGSIDGTEYIVLENMKNEPRIIYVPCDKNMGLPSALNYGTKLAKGQYITWTSHDNILMPSALEEMLHELIKTRSDFVYADCLVINDKGEEIGFLKTKPIEYILFSNVVHACFLYRREVAFKVGEYNPGLKLIEDLDYWFRCAQQVKMVPITKVLYKFRFHDSSLTSQIKVNDEKKKKFLKNNYVILENLFEDSRVRNKQLLIEFFLNTDKTISSSFTKGLFNNLINDLKLLPNIFPLIESKNIKRVIANRIFDFIVRNPEYHNLRLLSIIIKRGFLITSLPVMSTAVLIKKAMFR